MYRLIGGIHMKKEIFEWFKSIFLAIVLALAISSFVSGTRVHGASMNPTLEHEDFLIVFKSKNIKHGDIVIVKTDLEVNPEDLEGLNIISRWKMGSTKSLIKRVIAKEGDSIEISNGEVFLNGEKLKEDYINDSNTFGDVKIEEIPKDKVFVLGDNRGNSLDSRNNKVGLVNIKDIQGKAIFKVYPFSKIGKIH